MKMKQTSTGWYGVEKCYFKFLSNKKIRQYNFTYLREKGDIMAIIIAGFATCGKSVLGRKYKNVIELESSSYRHKIFDTDLTVEQRKGTKREINDEWPQNYYKAID